jgi:hypothetical protein
MTKYKIDIDSGSIEFPEMESASLYAEENNISTSSIYQIEETQSFDAEAHFEQLITSGFPVGSSSLALYDYDRSNFSNMLTLVNEGLMLGQMTTSSIVSIKSQEGNILSMTAIQFKILMLQYGFYYKTIWDQKQ